MKNYIFIIILLASFMLCASVASANQNPGTVDLPATAQITKDNDVSAGMLSKLLGTEWQAIAGGKAADSLGGAGKWAGVFTLFLNILNLGSMAFVSVIVMYEWGLATVVTAHEGREIGGRMFSSLWTPVRHAFAFSLAVPVTGSGLSLLQVIVIACVSMSINLANNSWDALGGYLVNHAQSGVVDNVPPFLEEESLTLIRPMFKSVVAQEVTHFLDSDSVVKVREQNFPANTNNSRIKYIQVTSAKNDKYTVIWEPLAGKITIYPTGTRGMSLGTLGAVVVPAPVMKKAGAELENADDQAQYNAMLAVAKARATAVIEMWEGLRAWAKYYLSDPGNGNRVFEASKFQKPGIDGLALAREYRDSVMTASKEHLAVLKKQIGVTKMLEKAIDSDGTKGSKLGWVSAGLMPFTFAQAQKRLDDLSFGGGSYFASSKNDYKMRGEELSVTANSAISGSYNWASEALLQGRLYSPVDEEGDGVSEINKLIAGIFLDNDNSEGILSGTLQRFRQVDPMVAISDFGRKAYNVAAAAAAISLGSAALSWVPYVGSTFNAIATNPFLVGGMYALFAVGLSLFFLPPIAVLAAWIWAILRWILTIVYVLIGAPLWAVAHAFPEGKGLAGEHARAGYYLVLDLFLRPTLLVGGVVTSIAVWQVAADLYNTLLSKYLNGFTAFNGSGLIVELIFSCIIFLIFGAIYLKVFTFCVNSGPNFIMDLFGRRGASTLNASDHDGQQITGGAALTLNKGAQLASNGAGALGSGVSGGAALAKRAGAAIKQKMNGGKTDIGSINEK